MMGAHLRNQLRAAHHFRRADDRSGVALTAGCFPLRCVREWMGPGGSRGLQHRCGAAFVVLGGFDSLALPPPISNQSLVPLCPWMRQSSSSASQCEPQMRILAKASFALRIISDLSL